MTKHEITTPRQLAADMGITIYTVRLWVRKNKIPRPNKVGSIVFWPTAVITQWLAETGKQKITITTK